MHVVLFERAPSLIRRRFRKRAPLERAHAPAAILALSSSPAEASSGDPGRDLTPDFTDGKPSVGLRCSNKTAIMYILIFSSLMYYHRLYDDGTYSQERIYVHNGFCFSLFIIFCLFLLFIFFCLVLFAQLYLFVFISICLYQSVFVTFYDTLARQ